MIKEDEDNKAPLIVSIVFIIVAIGGFGGFSYYKTNKSAHENFIKAQDAFRNSDLVKAEKLLAIKPSKDIAEDFYKLKYDVQMNQNKLYEAEITAKELVKLYPKDAFNNYLLSLVYYNLEMFEETEKSLKEAIKIEPKNYTYNLSLANVYIERQKYDEAIKAFLEVYKINPKAEIALASIANCYMEKNDMDKALEYRIKAANEFGTNLYNIYELAKLYEKIGKKELAIEYYEKAIKLDYEDATDSKEKYKKLVGKPYFAKAGYKTIDIPYRKNANIMQINATLGGKKGNFIVDTGASYVVVSEKFISGTKYKDTGMTGVATIADGSNINTRFVFANLNLNGFDFGETLVAVVSSDSAPLLLGNIVWKELDYYIDNSKDVIIIKRPKD